MNDFSSEEKGKRRSAGLWKMPLTNPFHESPKTSLLFAAQSRAYSNKKLTQNQPSTSIHTPRLCRTNPFEDISSLEFDKCSPGLFIVHQSSAEKGEFRWSIEDISRIMPAQIESPISVPEDTFDQETENAAQEAIERYFSFRHAVVSPPDAAHVDAVFSTEMCTPPAEVLMARAAMGCCRSGSFMGYSVGKGMTSAISSTPCARSAAERRLVIKVDECTQTRLSLPPTLPPELEAALRPYMSNRDDNLESEDCNISSSTLRRKLFFNKEDALSPVKAERNNGNGSSSSPMINSDSRPSRIEWTPDEKSERPQLYCLSSPDISPIKFKSKFEFTKDMSVDSSSFSSKNMNDEVATDQPISKPKSENLPPHEKEVHHHPRGIFSSTVQSSQIDRIDKDTGYSTMEVDCTHSIQANFVSNKT